MKLYQLFEKHSPSKEKGSYAGVKYSKSTIDIIEQFSKENHVKNALNPNKLHTTLLYSRKFLPDFKGRGDLSSPIVAQPKEFVIWKSKDVPPKDCLVLKLICPELEKRHDELMKEHGATYDFDSYHPHITFSYDAGDEFDLVAANKKLDKLKDLEIVSEYGEDLELDWNKNND